MRRALAFLLIAATSLPILLTGFVLVRFQVQRDRIIQERCVQRALPEAEQTCHGSCHLKKQLAAAEAQQANVPAPPRFELRIEPAVVGHPSVRIHVPEATARKFGPEGSVHLSYGYAATAEPVPWG
ncbi:MAG: hypothetical protein KA230_10615 [Flavobacteriales bacterium]|nr:hypothetical protein [Flavobacteriales bacterium]